MAKVKRRIKLECTVPTCKRVGYFPNKSRSIKERLEVFKHCKFCGKHTKFKETK